MKNSRFPFLVLGLVAVCVFGGCKKKAAEVSVDDAVKEATQAEPAAAAAQPATAPQNGEAQVQSAPAQQVNEAVADYKSGKYEEAIARLQKLRSMPTATPQQAMAVQDATAAVMNDLYALAAKGDARAQQAIQQYQRLQGH